LGQGVVRQQFHRAAEVSDLELRLRGERPAFGTLAQTRVELLHDLGLRVPHVEEPLGELGHHVCGPTAAGDGVVDAGEVRSVFAESEATPKRWWPQAWP